MSIAHARWQRRNAQGDAAREPGGVRRRDILARYAAVLAPVTNPVLHDVVGLTVGVDASTSDSLVAFCHRVGYAVRRRGPEAVSLVGPDFELCLEVSPNHRVREIRMRTGPDQSTARPGQFGRATFTAADGYATLAFR